MHKEDLEKKWLYAALGIIAILVGSIIYTGFAHNIHPPGKMETIDSSSLHLSKEFAEENLGVHVNADGSLRVTLVAARYGFFPRDIRVPTNTPLTFRIASADVLHGVHIPMTNMSTMIVPGYISTVQTTFPKPGDYPMLCNEYCGMGHDHMWSRVTVVAKEYWNPAEPAQPNGR